MPSYGGRLGGGAVCPLCRETASSEAEIGHLLEGRSAVLEEGGDASRGRGSRGEPSSEAEMSDPLEGRSATLERGGGVLRDRGSREGPSSEVENELPARGYIRYPRARRRLVSCSRVVPLPSSEAEIAPRV